MSVDARGPASLSVRLHKIISRLSRENGDPEEMSTLGEAAARLNQVERAMSDLLALMADTPYPEVHPAIERALWLSRGQ